MKPDKPPTEEDLEATAELPAIEFEPLPGRDIEAAVITDIYAVPAIPVGAPELAESLREVEQQLRRERARMEEVQARLASATAREAQLESRLAEAGVQQSALAAQLDAANARCAALDSQLQSRPAVEAQVVAARHAAADFAEMRRCSERQLEALTSWQGFRAVSEALLADSETRNAQLETQVAALAESLRNLERRYEAVEPARDSENLALKRELAELKSEFGALQTLLTTLRERQQHSAQQAEAEVARSRRLEDEVQASVSLLGGPSKNPERPARDYSGKHEATQVLPAEAPRRVLVRQQAGAEVVYPIGRRTTLGRMPDNDIQLDTTNVSRHHAVLLSSVEHCIIEDLNSTNGVLVNGRRISRHLLHDGDLVSVGKAEFRFQQRP